jgi:GDP-4-dehydro-6-deoxy-D-mannose reductase
MRILITGATGFVGGHLVERLLGGNHEIHGLSRRAAWPAEWAHLEGRVQLHAADLNCPLETLAALQSIRPDWIFHLAGYANTGKSFAEPDAAWRGNWQATFHLYESIARLGCRPRVLYASSGLIYGNPDGGDRICRETDALYPASPYAASKAAADLLSYQVTRSPGLDVIRVRCFNQIGSRQSPDYATANFARQIAAIERQAQPPVLMTGDLSGQRDLTDVRDMVRAFVALMERGQSGAAYNAASGVTHSMQSVLERLQALSATPVEVRQRLDPERRADTAVARADIHKIQAATGWRTEYTLEQSLADLLEYWRHRNCSVSFA